MKIKPPIYRTAILAAVVFAVYGQILFSPFHFDDRSSILANPALKSRSSILKNLWEYWPTRFLTTISFFLNYRAGGYDPSGYHLVNIFIHILNSILVYLLLASVLKRAPSPPGDLWAWLGALLFAVHPLQTQAVSYIAQRATALAAGFYLASLLLYVRGRIFYLFSWLLGACSMFCKEMAVTLPLTIILWDIIFLKKNGRRRWPRFFCFGLLILIIPAVVLLDPGHVKYNDSGQIGFRIGEKNYEEILGGIKAPDRKTYLITQIRVLITYLRLALIPVRQNLDYDYPVFPFFFQKKIVVSFLLILSLIIFSGFLMKKKKILQAFGILFFFLVLLPESSFIPIRDVIFEHRLYLPLLGMIFLFLEGLGAIDGKKFLLTLIIIFMAALTLNRNRVWKSETALWQDTIKKSPRKARPHNNLGYIYNQAGLYPQAFQALSRANTISADYPEALVNLAISQEHLDRLEEAEECCRRALRMKSTYPEAHNCLGDILRLRGRTDDAEKAYRRALELNPAFSEARNNLANLYQMQGKNRLAAREYRKILENEGDNPVYLNNLGLYLISRGETESAIKTFRRAIELDENLPQAHYNLGNALFLQGDGTGAIASFSRAVRLNPDYSRAYYNLGIVYSQRREWDQALNNFLRVTELEPESAAAYLKAGVIFLIYRKQPEEAKRHLRKALELNPALPERKKIEGLLNRLM